MAKLSSSELASSLTNMETSSAPASLCLLPYLADFLAQSESSGYGEKKRKHNIHFFASLLPPSLVANWRRRDPVSWLLISFTCASAPLRPLPHSLGNAHMHPLKASKGTKKLLKRQKICALHQSFLPSFSSSAASSVVWKEPKLVEKEGKNKRNNRQISHGEK